MAWRLSRRRWALETLSPVDSVSGRVGLANQGDRLPTRDPWTDRTSTHTVHRCRWWMRERWVEGVRGSPFRGRLEPRCKGCESTDPRPGWTGLVLSIYRHALYMSTLPADRSVSRHSVGRKSPCVCAKALRRSRFDASNGFIPFRTSLALGCQYPLIA